ncbi:MAG: CHC2 zinc finger domain-containing protein, partial [Terracidiphilus sp.]
MARVSPEEVERLQQDVSLVRLAESSGVELTKRGEAELIGRCPFHEDTASSLIVTPAKNLWRCLGACAAGGGVIEWVIRAEGVSFRHAVELLREQYVPSTATAIKHSTVAKLPTPFERGVDDARLLRRVVDYYHATLKQSPEALDYLAHRGLASHEAIDQFKLGFANRTLGYRLPHKNRMEGAALRGQLQRLGVMRASGHEHFAGSLVIPILDEQEQVVQMYGRKITERLREGTALHLYLSGTPRGVFNLNALMVSKEIILCKGLVDALTFWCAGYRNVTASYGTSGFTDAHLEAFKQHCIERVLIAYARNEEGDQAAERLTARLTVEGMECFRIQFPNGLDANEYALKEPPSSHILGALIR